MGREDAGRARLSPIFATERAWIRPVCGADAERLRAYHLANRAHLAPWEPERPEGFHDPEAWRARAALQAENIRQGSGYHFLAGLHGSGEILALCAFSNVARGAFLACHLGYSIDGAHQGRGLMSEILSALIPHVFQDCGLHRIMAAHLPENERSARLLARLGFEREGHARAYLKIAGRWRDHVLTARIAPDPPV
ncbi:GNAT family N-acetyltransferase [Neomegalonema sp.]|uniref:GNAT family N-acetyltransferase n=1 Tax=Neomegalonema sp. TaxID=2039713 RepID=UPI00261E2E50|nr:GNAT family N-acetyltransferase [Neomegalonema sp.]MDD2869178.1 GNAT family N-acetyltransferase [Neomegalonema sp.]